MNEKRVGILLSYGLVAVNAVAGLLFTTVLLGNLGQDAYGLYKLAVSWTALISVLDFGLGGTITRYVIKYKTQSDPQGEARFLSMAFVTYGVLAGLVLIIGAALCAVLPVFNRSITSQQAPQFRAIFISLVAKTCVLLFNHGYSGRFMAEERFVYIKLYALANTVLRVVLVCLLLPLAPSAITVVSLDLALSVALLLCNMVARKVFGLSPVRSFQWDSALFREIFVFTSSIFLVSVINQFNGNVDAIVLGMYSTTTSVGLYASIMQIYVVYCTLSTSVQEVFLPQVSKSVFSGGSDDAITESIITPSRMQLMVLGLALTGFVHLGEGFLGVWLADAYSPEMLRQGHIVGIVVMAAALWQLFQNSATNILKAKNMLQGKVVITAASTAANFLITLLLVPRFGMVGAAAGTAVSMIFGYGIATNIYYHKVVKINLKLYYKKTLSGLWAVILFGLVVGYPVKQIPMEGMVGFAVKAFVFATLYLAAVVCWGLNPSEKRKLKQGLGLRRS